MNKKIGIVTFPLGRAGITPLSNLIEILHPISDTMCIITGNEGYYSCINNKNINIYGINHQTGNNTFLRIANFLTTQLSIAKVIYNLRKNVDTYILFIGGEGLLIPGLTIKFLRKKMILSPVDYSISFKGDQSETILKYMIFLNRFMADKIIIHSWILIDEWKLSHFFSKISIAHEYFIDFNKFSTIKDYAQRKNIIGYVGRLSKEKGILNFLIAMKEILLQRDDVEFFIGGDGPLLEDVEKYINLNYLTHKVHLLGWIPHDKLPFYLNEIKLLVIPSHIESGPIIALEALSCGTPILASKVGHVLNMIENNKNGFIMENNSPECITKNVLRILNLQDIEIIISNGMDFVHSHFSYESAASSYWKSIEI